MINKKAILFILILMVFWVFLLPYPRVANDFHYLYPETGNKLFDLPYSWRNLMTAEGLGEYAVATLWSWPLNLLYGFLSVLGFNFSLILLIAGIIPFALFSTLGLMRVFDDLEIRGWGKITGAFIYTCNSYSLLLLDGGQINLALAYSLMPLNFSFLSRTVSSGSVREQLFFLTSLLGISILDFRILYIAFILIFCKFLFDFFKRSVNKREILGGYLRLGFLSAVFILGFHAYWILPSIFVKFPALPSGYNRLEQVDFLSFSEFGHSLFLLQPHWHTNIFGNITEIRWEFGFLAVFTFVLPLIKRDKNIGISFWMFIGILGVFLSKGSNPPFGEIYKFLFQYIYGFSLFRDPTKFYFLSAFSYSVLIGITINFLTGLKFRNEWTKGVFIFFPAVFFLYLLFLIKPVLFHQMNGLFSIAHNQRVFFDAADFLKGDTKFSRIFWIPTKSPLGFASEDHPAVEASRFAILRPFSSGILGNYESFNFLREAAYTGELFDVAGIGYIAYPPPDHKRQILKQDNWDYYYSFLGQISNLDWIDKKINNPEIALLMTKNSQDRLFIASNLWWIVGPDDIYSESTKSAKLKLSNNALVFSEEFRGLGDKLSRINGVKILLNKKSETDLAATLVDESNFIFPASGLDYAPDEKGWWKREDADFVWWKDFLKTKYGVLNQDFGFGGGWAVAEGDLSMKISDVKITEGDMLLARVLESTRSGEVSFYQDGALMGVINTKKSGDSFKWHEVGEIKRGGDFTVKTKGEINVLNSLIVLNKDIWNNKKNYAHSLLGKVKSFNPLDESISTGSAEVKFDQVNPAKIKVNISGISTEEYLVFSEKYDPNWRLNGQAPLPAYSMLNVFVINKDDEYILEYSAQKYVWIGLVFTALTVGIAFAYSIRILRKT